MTFYVDNETEEKFTFNLEQLLKDITLAVLHSEQCPKDEIMVCLTITDDESIRQVNKEFRNIDRSTDVLSFPNLEFVTPGDFSKLDPLNDFDPETNELNLGDIMISIDHAKAQANEYGHSLKREIAFLIAHSLFHLCGYDHMEENEREIMEQKQENILQTLNITREMTK